MVPQVQRAGRGGFVGDTLLVNGAQSPYVEVSRGWVRLRLLNAPPQLAPLPVADERRPRAARDFRRSGLLPAPVSVKQLALAPANVVKSSWI